MFKQLHTNRFEINNTKMAGLDPTIDYHDEMTDKTYGGDELMNVGLFRDPTHTGDFISEVHYFKGEQFKMRLRENFCFLSTSTTFMNNKQDNVENNHKARV